MKDDKLYNLYLNYLDDQLKFGKINRGSYSLLKISRKNFDDFKNKMENKEFESKQISNNRDKKIDDFFDEFDFD